LKGTGSWEFQVLVTTSGVQFSQRFGRRMAKTALAGVISGRLAVGQRYFAVLSAGGLLLGARLPT